MLLGRCWHFLSRQGSTCLCFQIQLSRTQNSMHLHYQYVTVIAADQCNVMKKKQNMRRHVVFFWVLLILDSAIKKNQCIPETQANTLYSVQTKQTLSQMLVNVFTLITAYSQRCLSTCVMFIQVDGVHYELRLQYSFRCGDMCKIKWNNPSFITLPYNL